MNNDLQHYNQQVLAGEKGMLLSNVALLHNDQAPHFMMLSEVDPTRTFTSSVSFQWSQVWYDLLIPFVRLGAINNGGATQKGSSTLQAGPLSAGVTESPTSKFIPIQGNDFAQRFESPLTDKFALFLEDEQYSLFFNSRKEPDACPQYDEPHMLINLFVQSLELLNGDKNCPTGFTLNDQQHHAAFSECTDEILTNSSYSEQIDASHQIPTQASDDPKAADLVTALQAGYKWTTNGKSFVLANPVRMPAWFNYDPMSLQETTKSDDGPKPVFWPYPKPHGYPPPPNWEDLSSATAPKYHWVTYTDDTGKHRFTLVPDGYNLSKDGKTLTKDTGAGVQENTKNQPSYADAIVNEQWPYPQNYFYVELREPIELTEEQKQEQNQQREQCRTMGNEQLEEAKKPQNKITPTNSQRMLRAQIQQKNQEEEAKPPILTDDDVWPVCYPFWPLKKTKDGGPEKGKHVNEARQSVVCGYFKIGNFLEIMQRLGEQACVEGAEKDRDDCVFGIGPTVPPFASVSAPTVYRVPVTDKHGNTTEVDKSGSIWVPAHDPTFKVGQRDLREFATLYKLYQMSLVDTSKLTTGSIPLTISK